MNINCEKFNQWLYKILEKQEHAHLKLMEKLEKLQNSFKLYFGDHICKSCNNGSAQLNTIRHLNVLEKQVFTKCFKKLYYQFQFQLQDYEKNRRDSWILL